MKSPKSRSRGPKRNRRPEDPTIDVPGLRLELFGRTRIMGILNVTPDSFSDGGRYFDAGRAADRAIEMVREGADIVDVGGESTRPGAMEVDAREEIRRVVPVIKIIAKTAGVPVSIDTRKSAVAAAAMDAGARMINDVSGLRHDRDMARLAAGRKAAVIVMHMRSSPYDMQRKASYGDLVADVKNELADSVRLALDAGIDHKAIVLDPGIGFAKDAEQSLEILRRLAEFKSFGMPICVGVSRKSFIGKVLRQDDAGDRLAGTMAACAIAVANGANILRVHDVAWARQTAAVADAIIRPKTG